MSRSLHSRTPHVKISEPSFCLPTYTGVVVRFAKPDIEQVLLLDVASLWSLWGLAPPKSMSTSPRMR